MSKSEKFILLPVVIIAVAGGAVYWFKYRPTFKTLNILQTPSSHVLVGQVSNVSGDKIQAYATHILDADPNTTDFTKRENVVVTVTPATKFVKTVWNTPTKESLAKIKKVIAGSPVSSIGTGSIDDIKDTPSISITVKTSEDTLNSQTVTATEIDYNIVVYK